MKKLKFLLFLLPVIIFTNAYCDEEKEVSKTFGAKDIVKIKLLSGDCIIKKGGANEISVHLLYTYSDDCFEYIFDEGDNKLNIEEEFHGRNCQGKSKWTISLPENTEIHFVSTSGDLEIADNVNMVSATLTSGDIEIKNCEGEVSLTSTSGDVEFEDLSGEITIVSTSGDIEGGTLDGFCSFVATSGDIETDNMSGTLSYVCTSGEIEIENITGIIRAVCTSGNVSASGIVTEDESSFISTSGDVEVVLEKSTNYDLSLIATSGDVILDYNGNEIKGTFEFIARVDKGEIISPFAFDSEEIFTKNGKEFYRKIVSRGGDTPKITLETYSGYVKLVK